MIKEYKNAKYPRARLRGLPSRLVGYYPESSVGRRLPVYKTGDDVIDGPDMVQTCSGFPPL